MAVNKSTNDRFNYNKAQKTNKNFMYKDLRRANCYNSDFSGSNFNYASFRGAHFKSCDFFECSFEWAEFIASNLKKSKFKKTTFKDVVFEAVNLDGADFTGAKFENVIFLDTDISKAVNLKFKDDQVTILEEMPVLEISEKLESAIKLAMTNEFIKKSRVLDTKDGDINAISVMRLLENFKEKALIEGLNIAYDRIDKDFCTLSYIIKSLERYAKEGLL
ncbi:MAG: pentapeptide repeat-containing protein [Clostridium sp.]|uniref:pentapeptide repeat-containing protein n=1 Tax=Clostridium sp. TaxID=1506 RepID=UPI003F382697